jgi:hypothetical protein
MNLISYSSLKFSLFREKEIKRVNVNVARRCRKCLCNSRKHFRNLLWCGWVLFMILGPVCLSATTRVRIRAVRDFRLIGYFGVLYQLQVQYEVGWDGTILMQDETERGERGDLPWYLPGRTEMRLILLTPLMWLPHKLTCSAYSYDVRVMDYNCIIKLIGIRAYLPLITKNIFCCTSLQFSPFIMFHIVSRICVPFYSKQV